MLWSTLQPHVPSQECKTLCQQIMGLTSIYLKIYAYLLTLHITRTKDITVYQSGTDTTCHIHHPKV